MESIDFGKSRIGDAHLYASLASQGMKYWLNATNKTLSLILVLLILTIMSLRQAHANPIYGYALGISMNNTVVPGTIVSINAGLANTGNTPIIFQPGGTTLGAGAGYVAGWNILANDFRFGPPLDGGLFKQFEGVVINPGEVFDFVIGNYRAPTNQPLGSRAIAGYNLYIDFTEDVIGNLGGIGMPKFNINGHGNAPGYVEYILGLEPSVSAFTFFDGLVVNKSTGQIISGPIENVSMVPEPSSLLLLTSALLGFRLIRHGKNQAVRSQVAL